MKSHQTFTCVVTQANSKVRKKKYGSIPVFYEEHVSVCLDAGSLECDLRALYADGRVGALLEPDAPPALRELAPSSASRVCKDENRGMVKGIVSNVHEGSSARTTRATCSKRANEKLLFHE